MYFSKKINGELYFKYRWHDPCVLGLMCVQWLSLGILTVIRQIISIGNELKMIISSVCKEPKRGMLGRELSTLTNYIVTELKTVCLKGKYGK